VFEICLQFVKVDIRYHNFEVLVMCHNDCVVVQGFGIADHSVATGLLKHKYPTYASITWSNEGY
jgi:hypothetical protein